MIVHHLTHASARQPQTILLLRALFWPAAFASQCRGDLETVLDLLAKSSAELLTQSMGDVGKAAEIREFWLALAAEASAPSVCVPAAQWLLHAALQAHAAAAQATVQAPLGLSSESSLADQLASLHLTAHDEGVQVRILACEDRCPGSTGPGPPPAAPAFAAAAVAAIGALSRALDPAQRVASSQCALTLLQPDRASLSQHSMQPGLSRDSHTEPLSDSPSASAVAVLDDNALVQLGHVAVKGLGDLSAEVAATWRRAVDAIAPDITRIAADTSRTSLAAFLLLHKVRQCFYASDLPAVWRSVQSCNIEEYVASLLKYVHGFAAICTIPSAY